MKKSISLIVLSLSIKIIFPCNAIALQVKESVLSHNAVVVILSAEEIQQATTRRGSLNIGTKIATEMLALAGVPKSVTAKVVTATAWAGLVAKYTVDIRKIARASRGSNVTLTYHGINLEGVRRIWTAAGPLDNMMPGGGLSKAIASTLSELSNSYFDR